MPVKKNSSNAKKSTNAVKRHAKFTVPTGEKVSSMAVIKTVDKSSPKLFNLCTKP
jgi:type VI protein secretion system component Hcp